MYHVIRSSGSNLDALDLFLNAHEPRSMVQPRLTQYRRTGRKRRPQPHQVLMYPGYAFVTPEALPLLREVGERWTHHFLRSATTGLELSVPKYQVDYALTLEHRSHLTGDVLPAGVKVRFIADELHGLTGTVQRSEGHVAIVWPVGHEFPITCLLTDVALVKTREPLPA